MTGSAPRKARARWLYLLAFGMLAFVWGIVRWTAPASIAARWQGALTTGTVELQSVSRPSLPSAQAKPSTITGTLFHSPVSTSTASLADLAPSPPEVAGYLPIGFRLLSGFSYDLKTSSSATPAIPEQIRQLHGQKVSVSGYMVPLDLDSKGKVRSFLLVKNQMLCCFGLFPGVNDYIGVSGSKEGFSTGYVMDRPVTVSGILRVGEVWKEGELLGLYLMTCDRVD